MSPGICLTCSSTSKALVSDFRAFGEEYGNTGLSFRFHIIIELKNFSSEVDFYKNGLKWKFI